MNRFGFSAETFGMVFKILSKCPEENLRNKHFFNFSFQSFFRFWAKYFQTFGQETSRSCQKYLSRVQTNNFCLKDFFKIFDPFWIFCRNLWHGSQNSIYVSRVKIAEEIVFFCFSFQIFFGFWAKKFSDFWPKNFKMFSKLPSTCPEEQFAAFFSKSFEPFSIFCRNLYDGSQNSIYVSRANYAEEIVFLFSFSEIFSDFERNFFRVWAKKLQEVVKTTFCVSRGTICDLIFFKVLNRFGFSAQTFGMALKNLSTCPE